MKILSYRELPAKDGLLPLMDQAFRWPLNLREFEKHVKVNPRLRHSPVGYSAVEDNRVVGFVGVMDLTSRNLYGEIEPVGGIWGVATLPSHVRRGFSTALMEKAHHYFQEKDYRFSFLCTSRSLIAYGFYRKLGYAEALQFPGSYRTVQKEKLGKTETVKVEKKAFDWNRILEIYIKSSSGRTGLVIRDKQYLKMLKKRHRLRSKDFIILENGYAVGRTENRGVLDVLEIVASSTETIGRLLELVEKKAKAIVCDRMVLDNEILRLYRGRGYQVQDKSHSVLMAKQLKDAKFHQVYGEKFYMTNLDLF